MNTEMDFKDEPKHKQVFCASGYCGSFEEYYADEEISDEEIKKAANDYHKQNGAYWGQQKAFIDAIKWYKQRLKDINQ